MNTRKVLEVIGLGLVGLLVLSFAVGIFTGGKYGTTTVNYNSSGNQALMYNNLASIVGDVQAVRAPLAGIVSTTTAAITFPTISSSTAGVTTTTQPTIPAALGDIVLIRPSTSSPGFSFDASVNTASTTAATFDINAHNNTLGATAVAPSSTLFYITVIPRASFVAPAALNTVTSTSN